jgi:hypothetical protein
MLSLQQRDVLVEMAARNAPQTIEAFKGFKTRSTMSWSGKPYVSRMTRSSAGAVLKRLATRGLLRRIESHRKLIRYELTDEGWTAAREALPAVSGGGSGEERIAALASYQEQVADGPIKLIDSAVLAYDVAVLVFEHETSRGPLTRLVVDIPEQAEGNPPSPRQSGASLIVKVPVRRGVG